MGDGRYRLQFVRSPEDVKLTSGRSLDRYLVYTGSLNWVSLCQKEGRIGIVV
jgi:hypothetical protein